MASYALDIDHWVRLDSRRGTLFDIEVKVLKVVNVVVLFLIIKVVLILVLVLAFD